MNNFMFRLSLAAALTLGVVVLAGSATAQEPSSQDPAATAPPQQQSPSAQDQQTPTATPEEPAATQQNEPQMPAAGPDAQTQDSHAFTGRIVKENGKVVLKDPVTKNSYQIDDAAKAKPYMGKQVKVTGKLDMNSNTIHVESIEPLS
jgi:hypothetical protein